MPGEGLLVFTGYPIPQTDGAVLTPTGKRPSIGTERYAEDPTRMSCEGVLMLTGYPIPQTDSIVCTRTSKCTSIGTERYAIDLARMPGEGF